MSSEGFVEYHDVGPYMVRTQSGDYGVDGSISEAIKKGCELGDPWGVSKPGQSYIFAYSD